MSREREREGPVYNDSFFSQTYNVGWGNSWDSSGWNGKLAELRVYNLPLSHSELSNVCSALIAKWAL